MDTTKPQITIAIAGISHETNTYCRDATQNHDFIQMRGDKIFKALGCETNLGGALAACSKLNFKVKPILAVAAQPSGLIDRQCYEAFKQEILNGLENLDSFDAVYLDLHGAGVVSGIADMEGDLAASIRQQVGSSVPITASFDLHGNITQAMADALDGVFSCHEYPHTDMHLRAQEAINLIASILNHGVKPVLRVETIPALLPVTTTLHGIGKETLVRMLAAEQHQDIIDISWFHGFPYTDIAHVGSHIVVTTDNNPALADSVAKKMAAQLWASREAFRVPSLSAGLAVKQAQDITSGVVVINENSDNCGGGAPGDGTHLLRAMLDAILAKACFGFIVDEQVAVQAHEAGVGATINIQLGAKYDDLHGQPLHLVAYVKALHDGKLMMQAMAKGSPLHIGKMARLVVAGIDIVVASKRAQTFDASPFEAVGIDVKQYPIVALKSSHHFRAGFLTIADTIVTADPPGLTTHKIELFPRKNLTRAMWPIDENAHYDVS